MYRAVSFAILVLSFSATAMPVKTSLIRAHAYMQDKTGGLHESLDLKSKTLTFSKKDFDTCGTLMTRTMKTMEYTCRLEIPTKARTSILQAITTPTKLESEYGGKKREIIVTVAPDARSLVLKTIFDPTGVDLEVSKFNDELYQVYAKVAQLSFTDALSRAPLKMEVLEGP